MFNKNNSDDLSEQEKLDYVFNYIKRKQRIENLSLFFRFFIISWIVYFYLFLVPSLDYNKLFEKYIIPRISDIVQMTAEKTVKNVADNVINNISSGSDIWNDNNSSSNSWSQIIITDEMINNVKNSMKID